MPPPQNSITSRPGKLHQFSSGLLPSSPNRLPCFCPLCHFYFPDRSQAMLLRGKSDYVTLLDLHQWFPVSHGAKTQMLTAPGRLPKSWIHPPSPAPRNLLDQIFYCSQSCSRYAAATLAFWLLLEPSPSDIQVSLAVPSSLWAFARTAFSDHHALFSLSCTYFYSITRLSIWHIVFSLVCLLSGSLYHQQNFTRAGAFS